MHYSTLLLPLFTSQALGACIYARSAESAPQDATHAGRALADLAKRAARPDKREPIGDLRYGITTPVGRAIADLILDPEDVQRLDRRQVATPASHGGGGDDGGDDGGINVGSGVSGGPACNIWANVSSDLTTLFNGCGDLARAAIRLGFHDAGEFDVNLAPNAGADGSMILFQEYNRPENNGLQNISIALNAVFQKFNPSGVGMADLIQFAAVHATRTCPLGPQVRAFVGRPDAKAPNPEFLLPNATGPTAAADFLINLFNDKTIPSSDLAALVGAHSVSKQFFVDPALAGESQDSTPDTWDIAFYGQTLAPTAPAGVFRFESDLNLSVHPNTTALFRKFAEEQDDWNEAFEKAYLRLSVLGVPNINQLTECTNVLPA